MEFTLEIRLLLNNWAKRIYSKYFITFQKYTFFFYNVDLCKIYAIYKHGNLIECIARKDKFLVCESHTMHKNAMRSSSNVKLLSF